MENTFQNSMQSSNLEGYMIQKKVEIVMDINNKRINNELKKINDMLGKLSEEIFEIKKNFNENSVVQKKPVTVFESRKESNQDDLNIPKNGGDKPKPRYGDYKPEDVNIDKFFYFGNKK